MGRSPCCEKAHTNKGAWTKEEDDRLVAYIRAHGEGCWRSLPKAAGLLRCGKSCRLRWINYLRPDLKRGNFTEEEDELIIKLHSLLGNKWSLIAGRLPGRTDNEIKNYWNTHIRRKLLSRGIDPATHRSIHETLPDVTIAFNRGEEEKAAVERKNSTGEGLSQFLSHQQQERQRPEADGLNLDLCISLPYEEEEEEQQQQQLRRRQNSSLEAVKEDKGLCLGCCLGLQKGRECRCRNSLGLSMGVLDYRGLEMKL
ncbi:hypothetical protein Taro_052738 [Colocasia esculenta]|uniref:Uncharacterized protein n=1 Tax=Colocasia esculenta TaxID=4460 RepID=A0A843XL33_COLES|nr:hypothetical protein [Colocasia esculenta]